MKKFIIIIFCLILTLTIGIEASAITLEFASNSPIGSPTTEAMNYFAELVEERSNGEITVEVFPDNQLGGNRELIEGASMGSHAMTIQGANFFGLITEGDELQFNRMPYVFESQEHVKNVFAGEIGERMAKELLEVGNVRLLTWDWDRFPRHLSSQTPIYEPEDLRGQTIRTGGGPIVDGLEILGANPVEIPLGEMYISIDQGVADGADLPLDFYYNLSLYEVNDYVNLVYHTFDIQPLVINEDKWQSLSEEHQEIIMQAAKEAGELNNKKTWETEQEYIDLLEENGMVIVESNVQAFVDAMMENKEAMYRAWPNVPDNYLEIIQEYAPSN